MKEKFEDQLLEFAQQEMTQDAAHDISHIKRVVKTAKALCDQEQAKLEVVLPAAYLHDCFTFPKNHPDRAQSSTMAADKAISFLKSIDYPTSYLDEIHHAIVTHSYSANITPETLEAQIVQDADRLDSLGAIGIARCLYVGQSFNAELYNHEDPFAEHRDLDDKHYSVDHFYVKLFKLAETMNTESAKLEANKRTDYMRGFLEQLGAEV
ncbi:HD domain-containing protein [Vibrio chagasii]|uniref:HD domain-containing protein n=1 Tax=Vibrio TaxID=662 RepID=UPI00076A047E|nr:HD domain-containing protein [Vibrio splendidus]MCG9607279.1 HD domain-containing protein [Vibrio chagasii]MDE9380750.1 HD domain-containing protein [Vibrio alginolyticus]CAH6875193.1 HD domain-containing protein [Vibrio chagasii]CAH6894666.1 HD domain-containing protein [Vibrio chagasii]CAH6910524.1 HD domain-containing protein [Vibrio chagasii]